MKIDLEPRHLAIVVKALAPVIDHVYVFGSRVKKGAGRFSDLDLVIRCDVSRAELIRYKIDLEESNLPYKVDLALWSDLDESFRRQIESDLVLLTGHS